LFLTFNVALRYLLYASSSSIEVTLVKEMHNNDILQISYLIYGMYDGLLFYAHLFDLEIKDHDHIW
jgi:hypothetical protein